MLPAEAVASVCPGDPANPANVRVLEAVCSEAEFAAVFPRADPAYTYTNLLRAVAAFPRVCRAEAECRATLAAVFAHFQQETAGLFYLEEINKGEYCAFWTPWVVDNFPCTPGFANALFFFHAINFHQARNITAAAPSSCPGTTTTAPSPPPCSGTRACSCGR